MATAVELYAEHRMSIEPNFVGTLGRDFGKSVLAALEQGKRHVIVDCRNWRHLDLILLSALVRCADRFYRDGALLEIINLTPEMRATIRELRLDHRLHLPA